MKKIICSPGCYVQGKGELANLAEYYKMLGSKGAYLIIDRFIYNNYLNEMLPHKAYFLIDADSH